MDAAMAEFQEEQGPTLKASLHSFGMSCNIVVHLSEGFWPSHQEVASQGQKLPPLATKTLECKKTKGLTNQLPQVLFYRASNMQHVKSSWAQQTSILHSSQTSRTRQVQQWNSKHQQVSGEASTLLLRKTSKVRLRSFTPTENLRDLISLRCEVPLCRAGREGWRPCQMQEDVGEKTNHSLVQRQRGVLRAQCDVCRWCARSLSLSVQLPPWWNHTSCAVKAKNIHGSCRPWLPGFTPAAGEAAALGGCSAGEPQPSTSHIPAPLSPAKKTPSCVNATRQNEDISDLEPCIIYTARCPRYAFNTHPGGAGRPGWTREDSCFAACGRAQRHFIAAQIEPVGIIVCAALWWNENV